MSDQGEKHSSKELSKPPLAIIVETTLCYSKINQCQNPNDSKYDPDHASTNAFFNFRIPSLAPFPQTSSANALTTTREDCPLCKTWHLIRTFCKPYLTVPRTKKLATSDSTTLPILSNAACTCSVTTAGDAWTMISSSAVPMPNSRPPLFSIACRNLWNAPESH